jgi:hypothetical protein
MSSGDRSGEGGPGGRADGIICPIPKPARVDFLRMEQAAEKTIANWFSRYRTLEAAANRLQKESKGYLDSLRGMLGRYNAVPVSTASMLTSI